MEVKRIGIDTSKSVFALHGVDDTGAVVLRRTVKRAQVLQVLEKLAPTEVALEACGASHHWGRMLMAQGHRVRLVPPQYVKPFVKRGKNDAVDAAAICEAAGRPDMSFVPVKSADRQAAAVLLRVRELLVSQRTQLANALRGHAGEFGVVVGRGIGRVDALLAEIERAAMPAAAREGLGLLAQQFAAVDQRLEEIDAQLLARHKADEASQRLAQVPGIGPIAAQSLVSEVDPGRFRDGRHFAAWLGLTQRQDSTGGRVRLKGISRAGHERLRQLLVLGAMAVVRHAKPGGRHASAWLLGLLERRPRKVAAVALANKMARIVWAMMSRGQCYRAGGVGAPAAG